MLFQIQPHQVSQSFRKVPLRLILVCPFILQIFAAVGLTGWLSLRNGQKAVNAVASQLRSEITARIQQQLNTYLDTAPHVNQLNANAIRLKYLNPDELESVERYLWQQIQAFPSLPNMGFATKTGEFIAVERQDNNKLIFKVADKEHRNELHIYESDSKGNHTKLLKVSPNYNILSRFWYQDSVRLGKPTWSKIFPIVGQKMLSLPAGHPVYDESGELRGVFVANFLLSFVSDFLHSLKIGRSGQTFIIERSGFLVASSTLKEAFITNNSEIDRLNALDSKDDLIRLTTAHLQERFGNLTKINSSQQLDFLIAHQRQFLQVMPFQDSRGLDWLIVVVVPESDFMDQINANTQTTILLCLGALTLATILGILTARWITNPILRLSEASRAIASGELDKKVEVEGVWVHELRVLGHSFNQMAAQLKASFEELEIRVEERTSELKVAKEVADSAKETADRANRSKSEFLANMSHELRTPLNAILGFAQLMNCDSSLNQEQQENLAIISRSGEHLLSLINDVLEMSKIEVGRATLNQNSFDLYYLLDSLEEMFHLKVSSKGLQLICERAEDVPQYLRTDQSKLRQVLINLLGNAIKFTQTGYIILRINKADIPQVYHQNLSANNEVLRLLFEIEDTGFGIASEEIDSLFEAFVQTEVGKKYHQGTGLGLPISRKFVQLMGGDITVSSQLGKGTIFKFDIQAHLGEENELRTKQLSRRVIGLEPNSKVYRILVVDDRAENRLLLVKLLIPLGFEVRDAANGAEAVALWSSWEPHLIWMDMRMPVMDGYEATKQIKSHLKGQATIIIALTASAFDEERTIVLSAGCDDFVSKPYQDEVIFKKMSQYLGVRYVYEEQVLANSEGKKLEPPLMQNSSFLQESLAAMPAKWVTELHQAAIQLDAEMILKLVAEIPANYASLVNTLTDWVNNFRFDKITNLIEQLTKRD